MDMGMVIDMGEGESEGKRKGEGNTMIRARVRASRRVRS